MNAEGIGDGSRPFFIGSQRFWSLLLRNRMVMGHSMVEFDCLIPHWGDEEDVRIHVGERMNIGTAGGVLKPTRIPSSSSPTTTGGKNTTESVLPAIMSPLR